MTKKVVAITGAAGYLGGRLIAYLNEQPWVERIIALDVRPIEAADGLITHRVDVAEPSTLRAILHEHGVSHLVHAAFQITPPDGNIEKMRRNNVQGSLQVFRTALNVVEHLTFISSVSVYGYHPKLPIPIRENNPLRPTMEYGRHKLEVEATLRILRHLPYPLGLKTKTAILRFAAIVGPHGAKHSSLRALTAQPMFIVSAGGRALTQGIHEDDAAALIGSVVAADAEGVFHGAPDDHSSWADIGQLSSRPVVSLPRIVLNQMTRLNRMLPPLEGFTRDVVDLFSESLVVDNTQTKADLDWTPRYTTCDAFYQMFKALGTAH